LAIGCTHLETITAVPEGGTICPIDELKLDEWATLESVPGWSW